ncbi:hypothetical protein IV203_018524 [Nitzschia inconspicua]|uniref:Uncharacterized protein n=1 Tax=Nitzschia inconspicua TaxID=303405 RepID=A0A9K3M3M9_9STRA|nr:hypothetical protein IV203_018524 [Nitzschia inconspicua]
MKFSSQVISNLEDTLSMKILAGPTRYGDIDRTYPAYEGEEDRSSNMVAQGVDVPSTQWRHVYPKARRNASIIDTGVNDSVPLSTMEIEDQLRGVLGLNHANQPRLASSVGQGKASSEVMNHERAFVVTKRSNRFNTQLGPPRPEGSDAGYAHFDLYMSSDAGLYTYRLRSKKFNKSNSLAGQRNGTSGLPKRSVKKPVKMRIQVKGKWTTVIKRHDKSLVNAKTGEMLTPTFRSRNQVTDDMDKFVTYVQDILDKDDNFNHDVTSHGADAETKKALKFAARVLVQAHQLARHPNRHQGFTVHQRDSYRALSKLALDIAKSTDTQGLEALLNLNSINNLGKKHEFDVRRSRRQNINNIRQHLRYERHKSHHHLARDHRHAMDSRHHDSRPTHVQHINH